MLKLMKLELCRCNIKTYIRSGVVVALVMLCFLYLLAYAPREIPDDRKLRELAGSYDRLMMIYMTVSMAAYAVLAAVMYSRLVIEEYQEKRALLLFSYPVSRTEILCAKLAVVFLFTVLAVMISNGLGFCVFGLSESIFPLVGNGLSASLILWGIRLLAVMALTAAGVGIIAAGIGFFARKSVPATIISALLIVAAVSNVTLGSALGSDNSKSGPLLFIMMLIIAGADLAAIFLLSGKVNRMEV